MKNKKIFLTLLVLLVILLVLFRFDLFDKLKFDNSLTDEIETSNYDYDKDPVKNKLKNEDTLNFENNVINLITPNGGELYLYKNIAYAGDLPVRWSSNNSDYKPTNSLEIYIINSEKEKVRSLVGDSYYISESTGLFSTSFVGASNLKLEGKYKVLICDYFNGQKYCDQSLDYFGFYEQNYDPERPEGIPVISSIVPNQGSIGTEVVLKGSNLSGFEGDLVAIFEGESGEKIRLSDKNKSYEQHRGNQMTVQTENYCIDGYVIGEYSGTKTECEPVNFRPGLYKVYVEPWGNKSNEVYFEFIN